MKKTVSETFRTIVFSEYPRLKDDLRYQRHFRRLLFTTLREDGKPIAGQQQLARDEGKEDLLASKNYSAIAFMEEFQREVMDPASYQWSGYSYADKLCRVLTVTFPKAIQDTLEKELQGHWANDKRVYFVGGRKFNPQARREALQNARDRAAESLNQNDCEAAKRIQNYMNSLHPHRFTKTLTHWDEALQAVLNLNNLATRDSQLMVLHAINDQPVPVYAPSPKGNTVRLFGVEASMLNLKGEIRRILTPDWVEADLVNAQLAIAAKLWNIPEVQQYLAKGESIWKDLVPAMGVPLDSELYYPCKAIVKDYLYGTIFGMSRWKMKKELNQHLQTIGIKDGGRKFIKHWAIKALLHRRQAVMAAVKKAGYGETHFGKRIQVQGTKQNSNVPSILAQQAQAVEMALILPIFELAENTNEFQVMLYQFDGVSLDFKEKKRPERVRPWKAKIQNAVQAKADALGIMTRLEFK